MERAPTTAREDARPTTRDKMVLPRKAKADFIIRIEDRFGERMQVSVSRFLGQVRVAVDRGRFQSARQFCRGLEHLLTKSA